MSLLTGQTGGGAAGSGAAGAASSGGAGGTGGNQQQQQVTDWRAALPEDLRGEAVFADIKGKDWAEAGPLLAKNYVHAQRLVGAKGVIVPGEKATPEEWNAYYKALGRPDKPEDYAITLPEGVTEDRLDKTRIESWRKELHAQGLTKKQAEAVIAGAIKEEFGGMQAREAAQTKQMQEWELKLRTDLGQKYDETLNYAKLGLKQFGNEHIAQLLDESGLGSHPEVVKLFAAIGHKLSDDTARGGAGGTGGLPTTPEAAQHALNVFNLDKAKQEALFNKNHPQHDTVKAERARLFKAAFPGVHGEQKKD